MFKEDAVAGDNVRHWAFGELSGAPGQGTSIGVARDVTLWATTGKAGEVMPRGLFSTPLVRSYGSGPRTGCRGEIVEHLPSSS